MKFLLWAAVAAIVVLWLTRSKKIASGSPVEADAVSPPAGTVTEPMVQCAQCGIHLPASESVKSPSGKVFCSEDHRLRYDNS